MIKKLEKKALPKILITIRTDFNGIWPSLNVHWFLGSITYTLHIRNEEAL